MKTFAVLEPLAFVVLFATLIYAWFGLAPSSPFASLDDPENTALIAAVIASIALLGLRLLPQRLRDLERLIPAVFLAAMPLIYLWGALRTPNTGPENVWLEVLGLVIFASLAIWGHWRSDLIVALGIAAHGLTWDAWHHGFSYIQNWYAVGCLIIDVALAFLLVAQFLAKQSASPRALHHMTEAHHE